MHTITFEDKYRIAVNESPERFSQGVKKGTAILYYLEEKLTLAQAAEMAEMDLYDFMQYLGSIGISSINYSPEDLEKEMKILNDNM